VISIRAIIGWLLIGLSIAGVIQSAREWRAWTPDARLVERDRPQELPIRFAGHRVDVRDDQPTDSIHSERAVEGHIQLFLDGRAIGAPTRALVRPGRRDLGRYHTWLEAVPFRDRTSGKEFLFLARRLEPRDGQGVRFEVNQIDESGAVTTRVLRGSSLGRYYPVWRTTQFLRANEWEAFPLSMLDAVIFWPILVVYPFGTLLVGIVLVWRARRRDREVVSA
jgi:hypothetical protein